MSARGPKPIRYPVHGRMMTRREVAEEVGVRPKDILCWQQYHADGNGAWASMEAAYDHYTAVRDGLLPRYPGRSPRRYPVGRAMLSVADMAKNCGVTANAFQQSMFYHRHGAVQEYRRRLRKIESKRTDRAVQDILATLKEARRK